MHCLILSCMSLIFGHCVDWLLLGEEVQSAKVYYMKNLLQHVTIGQYIDLHHLTLYKVQAKLQMIV